MILPFINIRKVLRELLETSGFALGFQQFPRNLAIVNEWKIMFDPSINSYLYALDRCALTTIAYPDRTATISRPTATTNELLHGNTNCLGFVHTEDSDQLGHPPGLIRALAVHSNGSRGPQLS